MTGDRVVLRRLPSEEGHCPVPGLLVNGRWQGPTGDWWAGGLTTPATRVVAAPAGRLDLTGPGRVVDEYSVFFPRVYGEQLRVAGTVEGETVEGTVDQPGARGFVANLTAVTRERKRVRLQLSDGREWWLRGTRISTLAVSAGDGRLVGTRTGPALQLARDAEALDHLVATLLITGIDRGAVFVIGPL